MAFWILKTEPSDYAFADLQRDGATAWDGVTNAAALIHLRAMRPGDEAAIYHTGDERAAVGLAQVTSEPYPDPNGDNPKHVVVTVAAGERLARPVTLAQLKAHPAFQDSPLIRQGRLSVVPCTEEQRAALLTLDQGA
ncbi:MAG TPA: EVE domain-containing protein [Herpetosiphonaceae bacterium]